MTMGTVRGLKGVFEWKLHRKVWRIRVPEHWEGRLHRRNSLRPEGVSGAASFWGFAERADLRGVNDHGCWIDTSPVLIRGRWVARRLAGGIASKVVPRNRRRMTSRERAANSLEIRVLYPHCPF